MNANFYAFTAALAVLAVLGLALTTTLSPAERRSGLVVVGVAAAGVLALMVSCTPAQAGSVAPTLADVAQRVDLARVLECAGRPDRWRCLGAATASAAIDAAADRAEALAAEAQAALAGTGASDSDEAEIAAELDRALIDLGAAIGGAP